MPSNEQQRPTPPLAYVLKYGLPDFPVVRTEPDEPTNGKRRQLRQESLVRRETVFDFAGVV